MIVARLASHAIVVGSNEGVPGRRVSKRVYEAQDLESNGPHEAARGMLSPRRRLYLYCKL